MLPSSWENAVCQRAVGQCCYTSLVHLLCLHVRGLLPLQTRAFFPYSEPMTSLLFHGNKERNTGELPHAPTPPPGPCALAPTPPPVLWAEHV